MHRNGRFSACIFGKKTIENKEKALLFQQDESLLKGKFHTIIGI